jgi:selenide,water dikinase
VTTDFFTPVVDDAYDYGAIAAANSLSDVYAMGGTPFLALNVAAFPPDLPVEIGQAILRGGAEKAREAGVVIAGGHTVQDREPKYGLVALGWLEEGSLMTRAAAQPGEVLFLTKPLGTGVMTTALKNERADVADVREVTGWMTRLNRGASALAREFSVRAATDITGFGLLGHATELASASGVRLRLHRRSIPFLRGALRHADMRLFPGGTLDNQAHFGGRVDFDPRVPERDQTLLFDAQTSGGLLLCVDAQRANEFVAAAAMANVPAWPIGTVEDGSGVAVDDGALEGWERVSRGQVPEVVFVGEEQ